MYRLPIFLVTLFLTACSPADSNLPTSVETRNTPVNLQVSHRSEWRVLWIEGKTDLPDGAQINYRLTHEIAQTSPSEDWPAANLIESGRVTVREGQYWTRVNTLNWPRGEVEVILQFPLPPQPEEVVLRYGEFGEYLTGQHVIDLGGMQAVEVEYRLEHTP